MLRKGNRWRDNYEDDIFKNLFEERESCCLTEHGLNGKIQTSSKEFWMKKGYKIVSAKEYLGPPKKVRKIGSLGIDFNGLVKKIK